MSYKDKDSDRRDRRNKGRDELPMESVVGKVSLQKFLILFFVCISDIVAVNGAALWKHLSQFLTRSLGAWIAQWLKTLACHCCYPGSNPSVGMWQGCGRPSKVGGFPQVLRFPPPHMTTECQHPRF